MPFDDHGDKWACEPCVRGHRSSQCEHYGRIMIRVKRPGRPIAHCPHQTRSCHCGNLRMVMARIHLSTGVTQLVQFYEVDQNGLWIGLPNALVFTAHVLRALANPVPIWPPPDFPPYHVTHSAYGRLQQGSSMLSYSNNGIGAYLANIASTLQLPSAAPMAQVPGTMPADQVFGPMPIAQVPGPMPAAQAPDAALVSQAPDAALVSQAPDAALVSQTPDAALVSQTPDEELLSQTPDEELVSQASDEEFLFLTPDATPVASDSTSPEDELNRSVSEFLDNGGSIPIMLNDDIERMLNSFETNMYQ